MSTGVNPDTRVRDLAEDDLVKIRDYVDDNFKIEGDLRREIQADIRRKVEIGCYQGLRHRRGLPGPRSAHPDQRPHPQGPASRDRRQEEAGQEVVRTGHADSGPSCRTDHLPGVMPDASEGPYRPRAKKVRRKEKKNVAHGHAHIKSTFNNTIVSITDPSGQRDLLGLRRPRRLQGLPQVHPVRRADGRRERRPPRAGARHAQGRRLRQGSRLRP